MADFNLSKKKRKCDVFSTKIKLNKSAYVKVVVFSLTWWVSADVAGVSVWNIVFQQAHAGAMLPAQTIFTLDKEQVCSY